MPENGGLLPELDHTHGAMITRKTGLVVDAYFSGSKVKWILDHVPDARKRARDGELLFGTVDTWLIWRLTNGACHVTDDSNASRTMLMDLASGEWDPECCRCSICPCDAAPHRAVERGGGDGRVRSILGQRFRLQGLRAISRRRSRDRRASGLVLRRTHTVPGVSRCCIQAPGFTVSRTSC